MSIWGRIFSWVFPPGPEISVHEMSRDFVAPGETASWSPIPEAQWYADLKIVGFLEERIGEFEYLDGEGAAKCREAIDNCCDRIDGTGIDGKKVNLRGRINDMRSLKRLARNWADHPDYRPEWSQE